MPRAAIPPWPGACSAEIAGEVLLDPFDRGRYSTDASIYQVEPLAVVVPKTDADAGGARARARVRLGDARGGGTSQAGQTVGEGLVIDYSKYLGEVIELDAEARTVWVEPGVVLDRLNRHLRPHGLFFPVDISTSSRATLGGMAANNACGARSIRYGIMVDNLLAIDALLAHGEAIRFGEVPGNLGSAAPTPRYLELIQSVRAIAAREADAIATAFPRFSAGSGATISIACTVRAQHGAAPGRLRRHARPVSPAPAAVAAAAAAPGPRGLSFPDFS